MDEVVQLMCDKATGTTRAICQVPGEVLRLLWMPLLAMPVSLLERKRAWSSPGYTRPPSTSEGSPQA